MKGLWRLLHWGPLTALSIILVLFVCSVLADIVWFPPEDFYSIVHLTIFCFWVFLILKYFLKAAFVGPGLLPQQWYPASENEKQYLQFCIPCEGYKAPRAHHCRQCKRCVMKMDHHCPWINNCVGHKNHKSFTLFLLFVVIGCSHGTIVMSLSTWNHLIWADGYLVLQIAEDDWVHMNSYMLLFFFFGIGLSVGVTVAVGVLLYYQVKSIIRNETGIEAWIVEKAARSRVNKEPFIYPYDLGFWKNIAQVMTFQEYVGDGIYWTIRDDSHQFALTVEQKEQKKLKRERMILHKVVSSYSGTWFPCRFGCKVCIDLPCSDDPRMAVAPNDNVYVTRWRKHWLYGEKVKKGDHRNGKWKREKGWFPRSCAMEVADEDIESLNKQL